MDAWSLIIYALPFAAITAYYVIRQRRMGRRHRQVMQDTIDSGMTEPASLHPLIDPAKCLGCGACVKACPETSHHDVLGIIDGKAALIGPTECIGHGACKSACPFDAITLVFGTERRGLDIPVLKPNFESNVPGVYVAGELGGMGPDQECAHAGAAGARGHRQGAGQPSRRARRAHRRRRTGGAGRLARRQEAGPRLYLTIEQEALGGAVFQYPRGKLVMTAPAELPIIGKVQFRNT